MPDFEPIPGDTTETNQPPTGEASGRPPARPAGYMGKLGCGFWLLTFAATLTAGGVFGLVIAGPAGLVVGPMVAAFWAVPVHLALAIVGWSLRLDRYRIVLAAAAGGVTGVVASLLTIGGLPVSMPAWGAAVLAGMIGGIGGLLAGALHVTATGLAEETDGANDGRRWQFSLRGLLVATAVAAVVMGGVRVLLNQREKIRCVGVTYEFVAVYLAFQNFDASQRSLPYPIRRAGGGGGPSAGPQNNSAKPLSGWRFTLMPYRIDSIDVHIAYDKPWDDAANRQWSTMYSCGFCFDDPSRQSCQTNVLAITGPGTAFGDGEDEPPRALDDLPGDTILAVEVRHSGIHWMQPGDFDIRDMPQEINRYKEGRISGCTATGFHVIFADGAVWVLKHGTPFAELKKFFTVDGARQFDRGVVLGPHAVATRGGD